jgi:Fe-S cluster biogenesis protein NfuA
MSSWFSKIFSPTKEPVPTPARSEGASKETGYIPLAAKPMAAERPASPPGRRVVNAPVLVEEAEKSSWSEEIRIKARPDKSGTSCLFLVDRPVLEGLSAWIPTQSAAAISPLAQSLFEVEGVESILLHDLTVTVTRHPTVKGSWENLAKEIGGRIRSHLKGASPVVTPEFLSRIPGEEEIREKVQKLIDLEINPGVAAHSGVITLTGVKGNTVTISMGGGCQGCAASTITLKEGIHRTFREAIPELGAILDDTDHAAGTNPFFSELPAGMRAYA